MKHREFIDAVIHARDRMACLKLYGVEIDLSNLCLRCKSKGKFGKCWSKCPKCEGKKEANNR